MEIDPTNPPIFMLDDGVELEVRLDLPSSGVLIKDPSNLYVGRSMMAMASCRMTGSWKSSVAALPLRHLARL